MISNIRTLAALLMAGAAFAACSNSDDSIIAQQPANSGEQVYTLTINATKGDNAATRALALDGTTLVSSWATTDVIYVTKGTTAVGTLSPSNISADGQSATFTGTLDGTKFAVDDGLTLTYHPITGISGFAAQDGTLKGTKGAENFDVATATVTVKEIVGSDITIKETGASFATQTAMIKLTLTTDGTTTINATSLKVSVAGEDIITFSPAAGAYTTNGDGILYFALPNAAAIAAAKSTTTDALALAPITFTASDGTNTYVVTKMGYPFAAGTYYASTLTMTTPIALNLTTPVVGQVIGDDGVNYASGSLPSGVTAVAKICYVSGTHGLALALADEGYVNWSTAISTCFAHTPVFTGGTWKLATQDEWTNMINAADGYTNLRDGFTSVGGTNMKEKNYWTSSEYIQDGVTYGLTYYFSNGINYSCKKSDPLYVRACLAF